MIFGSDNIDYNIKFIIKEIFILSLHTLYKYVYKIGSRTVHIHVSTLSFVHRRVPGKISFCIVLSINVISSSAVLSAVCWHCVSVSFRTKKKESRIVCVCMCNVCVREDNWCRSHGSTLYRDSESFYLPYDIHCMHS